MQKQCALPTGGVPFYWMLVGEATRQLIDFSLLSSLSHEEEEDAEQQRQQSALLVEPSDGAGESVVSTDAVTPSVDPRQRISIPSEGYEDVSIDGGDDNADGTLEDAEAGAAQHDRRSRPSRRRPRKSHAQRAGCCARTLATWTSYVWTPSVKQFFRHVYLVLLITGFVWQLGVDLYSASATPARLSGWNSYSCYSVVVLTSPNTLRAVHIFVRYGLLSVVRSDERAFHEVFGEKIGLRRISMYSMPVVVLALSLAPFVTHVLPAAVIFCWIFISLCFAMSFPTMLLIAGLVGMDRWLHPGQDSSRRLGRSSWLQDYVPLVWSLYAGCSLALLLPMAVSLAAEFYHDPSYWGAVVDAFGSQSLHDYLADPEHQTIRFATFLSYLF